MSMLMELSSRSAKCLLSSRIPLGLDVDIYLESLRAFAAFLLAGLVYVELIEGCRISRSIPVNYFQQNWQRLGHNEFLAWSVHVQYR
jgi:hypothetical protein